MFRLARRLAQPRAVSRALRTSKASRLSLTPQAGHSRSLATFRPTRPAQNSNASDGHEGKTELRADQLFSHMQQPHIKRFLNNTLDAEEAHKLMTLSEQVYDQKTGAESLAVLNEINALLTSHGVGLQFSQRNPPSQPVDQVEQATLGRGTSQSSDKSKADLPKSASTQQQGTSATAHASLYPDLMTPDPLLDARDVLELPPDKDCPYHNRVIVRNHTSVFNASAKAQGIEFDEDYTPTRTDETEEASHSLENLPLTPAEQRSLYRFPLINRRVTQQTGKGKIHRTFVLTVVGDGNGMLGLGQAKDEDATRAGAKAFAEAVRNMDWVERFEKRTIWTDMETKLGATRIIMRPRPVGFGLRCNPWIHQVLKAAGIKDISAKVWGSRNKINVIKATMRMLQAGHAPLAMGDGVGGSASKLSRGSGLRSKSDIERERGRPLINLRK